MTKSSMTKNRAIPEGFMTVGEMAKKMGVTVRTLQYYDREGLLSPSAESEGGRRLYTEKDLVALHQILSLKSLGFSLDDIRHRLRSMETPDEVADALEEQAKEIREKIQQLNASLSAIQRLRAEVRQMQTVNFKKYADIIVNLQMKNEYYYLIKRFDDDTLDHIRRQFDRDSGLSFIKRFNGQCEKILELQRSGALPESEECQQAVKAYWDLITEFTGGDMSMLPKLMEIGASMDAAAGASADTAAEASPSADTVAGASADTAANAWEEKYQMVNQYLEPALEIYFADLGANPFQDNMK